MGDKRKVAAIATLREAQSMKLQRDVVRYFRRLAAEIAEQFLLFEQDGVNSAINNAETQLMNDMIKRNGETADIIGNKQLSIIDSRVKKQFEVDFANQMNFFITSRALQSTAFISQTDRKTASNIITSGFNDGLSNPEIAKKLQSEFTTIATAYRAATIARTETAIAAAEAQERGARESGVDVVKEWVAIEDDRTRTDHSIVDGQIREMDGTFQVGPDTMKAPHDPNASAGNVINCRCVMNYIPRDSQ